MPRPPNLGGAAESDFAAAGSAAASEPVNAPIKQAARNKPAENRAIALHMAIGGIKANRGKEARRLYYLLSRQSSATGQMPNTPCFQDRKVASRRDFRERTALHKSLSAMTLQKLSAARKNAIDKLQFRGDWTTQADRVGFGATFAAQLTYSSHCTHVVQFNRSA